MGKLPVTLLVTAIFASIVTLFFPENSVNAQTASTSTCNISYSTAKQMMLAEDKTIEIHGVIGTNSAAGLFILFTNTENDWSMLSVTYPSARACIIASGTNWQYDTGRDAVLGIITIQSLPNPSSSVCRLTSPFTPPIMKQSREAMVATLKNRFGEVRVGFGLAHNGSIVELFEDPGGFFEGDGSWTLLNTDPQSRGCILLSGRFGFTYTPHTPPFRYTPAEPGQ